MPSRRERRCSPYSSRNTLSWGSGADEDSAGALPRPYGDRARAIFSAAGAMIWSATILPSQDLP
jgi:hypothetical protein